MPRTPACATRCNPAWTLLPLFCAMAQREPSSTCLTNKNRLSCKVLRAKVEGDTQHGCPFHRISHGLVRPGLDPGQALFGDRGIEIHLLQHAAQDVRLALEAAVHV